MTAAVLMRFHLQPTEKTAFSFSDLTSKWQWQWLQFTTLGMHTSPPSRHIHMKNKMELDASVLHIYYFHWMELRILYVENMAQSSSAQHLHLVCDVFTKDLCVKIFKRRNFPLGKSWLGMTSIFSHMRWHWNTNSSCLISASVHLPFFLSSLQQHMEHQQTRGQLGLTWKNEKAVLILKIGCGS